MSTELPLHPESIVVAAGRPARTPQAPMTTPIVLTAPYQHGPDDNHYSRHVGTDTVRAFEDAIGALEGGHAVAFGSGMAATAAVVEAQPLGTVAVVPDAAYSGTVTIFDEQARLGRMTLRPVDVTATESVVAALDGADLLWLESVTNPLLGVADLPPLMDAARATGTLACVDATFSTPLNVRPLEHGADIVMHSATKYLSGHSDVLLGVLVAGSAEHAHQLRERRSLAGSMPGALECFLALRGLRTLAVRWERAQANAAELAQRLAAHPRVSRVRFPGLANDPGHAVIARLHRGYGAMIAFELDASAAEAEHVCDSVRLISHATSLGGVETLLERRARYPVDAAHGTPPTLLRLSVGIEHVEDLWADLAQALRG